MSFLFLIAIVSLVILGGYTIFLATTKHTSLQMIHELYTSLKQLQAITNIQDEGICILTLDKEVSFCNRSALTLLNVNSNSPTLSDLLGSLQNPYSIAAALDDTRVSHISYLEKNLKVGSQMISIYVSPIISEKDKELLGIALIIKDMALERSVSQMKEDFTNIICHELRSPLTTIRSASQFVRSQGERLSSGEQHKLLTMIDDQSQKLLTEIELILDAAKLEIGEFVLHKTPGNFESVIDERVAFLLPEAEAKHITLERQIDETIPSFAFDSRYLSLALTNILSNSLKFTPLGGKIIISINNRSEGIKVTISDTGVGIPYAKQKEVFSKFSHLSSPSAKVGTGIGLYIVKGIVEAHGGEISLESEENYGTTISFTLPCNSEIKTTSKKIDAEYLSTFSSLSN